MTNILHDDLKSTEKLEQFFFLTPELDPFGKIQIGHPQKLNSVGVRQILFFVFFYVKLHEFPTVIIIVQINKKKKIPK